MAATIRITDVRMEGWYKVTSGKDPSDVSNNITPCDLSAAARIAIEKEIDVERVRRMMIGNHYSSPADYKMAGNNALNAVVDCLNTVRKTSSGLTITAADTSYISFPGGGHSKAAYLNVGNATTPRKLWQLTQLQIKHPQTQAVETQFDASVAIGVDYVVVTETPAAPPTPGSGGGG